MKKIKKICLIIMCVFTIGLVACKSSEVINVNKEKNLPDTEIIFDNSVVIHKGEGKEVDVWSSIEKYPYISYPKGDFLEDDIVVSSISPEDFGFYYDGITTYTHGLYSDYFEDIHFYNQETIEPGQITASVLFDNDDYDYWLSLQEKGQDSAGIFNSYQEKYNIVNNRITLKINGVKKAQVTLYGENNEIEWVSYADKNGVCYLFNSEEREEYKVNISYLDSEGEVKNADYTVKNNDKIRINDESEEYDIIQLMFIIDTTGSMMDEIDYLKAEIKDVIERIKEKNTCKIYLSIMLYRDTTDLYITKYYGFTDDIDAQVNNLSPERAAGGGDFEEAVQIAFEEATEKQWLDIPSTKIIIHVADAPSHDSDVDSWMNSVKKLASKGVRIINVASSGIDKKTEYLFRNECILTNGCYVYLTNHSHIGSYHIDATTSEKAEVEYLNDLLVRLIDGMYTGTYEEAINYNQVVKGN